MTDRRKVLIIDDENEIGQLLSAVLVSLGYTPFHAVTLRTGISAFRNNSFDIVFLDLMLPDGSGFSIIPELQKEQKNADVVVISANDSPEEKQRAKSLGVEHYLAKPFNRQQIENVLLGITLGLQSQQA